MRILLVAPMFSRTGGAEVYNEALAKGLAQRGHQVNALCWEPSAATSSCCETTTVTVPSYDRWPVLWRLAPLLVWRFWQSRIAAVPLPPVDLVICTKAICASAVARKFPGVPWIYLPHSRIEPLEIDQSLPASTDWFQWKVACSVSSACERWSLLHATATVRFTDGNVADLRRHYRLPEQVRFEVIAPGIVGPETIADRTFAQPLRLISVCRLIEFKNLAFLLKTLASLAHLPWQLDIVGDGPERAALERRSAELAIDDRVRFHGQQDDIAPFYRAAHLHVFPSRLESLGLVVLEAMAHGVPTLAIAADGARYRNANHEIITPGVDGLLARSEEEFCRSLESCLAHPECLSNLSLAARRTYLERHQWPVVLDRWEELLHDLAPAADAKPDQRSTSQRHLTSAPALART